MHPASVGRSSREHGSDGISATTQSPHSALQSDRINHSITEICRIIRWGLVCSAAVVALYFVVTMPLLAMSGKKTVAEVNVSINVFEKVAWFISVFLGTGGIYYGKKHRQLAKIKVADLNAQLDELQKRWDPLKASSNLRLDD